MLQAKRLTVLLITISLLFALSFPVAARGSTGLAHEDISIEQAGITRYTNINSTYLSRGKTWIAADFNTKSNMYLRIDLRVYKAGTLDYSDYVTKSNYDILAIDANYSFVNGVSYIVEATYTAGSEVVTKSLTFTHYQ